MTDSVVCPVCRSRNAPGSPVCATCGAPLAAAPGPGGRPANEVTGLPPGFPLWPIGEPDGGARPAGPPPSYPMAPQPPMAQQPPMPAPAGPMPPPPPPMGPPPAAAQPMPAPQPMPMGPAGGPPPQQIDAAALAAAQAASQGAPPPGWNPPPPASGPWGPGVPPPPEGWPQEPPPGWNQPPAAGPRPVAALPDAGDDEGWLPVSAASRGTAAPGSKPGDCWNCGQSNGRNREYCKRCGQRLNSDLAARAAASHQLTPVSGGRGRRAVAFIWTVFVLAAVVVVGVVAFGGFLPKGSDASPSPIAALPSPSAAPSVAPSAVASLPVVAVSASPIASLVPTPVTPSAAPTGAASGVAPASPASSGLVPLVTPTPAATLPPRATPTPTAAPTPTPPPTPTAAPTAPPPPTAAPTPTLKPLSTSTPPPVRSTASPRAPAPGAFTCEGPAGVRDPLNRGWKLSGVYWVERDTYDRITVRLVPDPAADGAVARVQVETVPTEDLPALGLPAPAEGDVATLIRFAPTVSLTRALQGTPGKTAVKTLTTLTAPDGRVYAVLGVAGEGCFAVQVPAWDDPSTQDTPFVDVTVDIQH